MCNCVTYLSFIKNVYSNYFYRFLAFNSIVSWLFSRVFLTFWFLQRFPKYSPINIANSSTILFEDINLYIEMILRYFKISPILWHLFFLVPQFSVIWRYRDDISVFSNIAKIKPLISRLFENINLYIDMIFQNYKYRQYFGI